ncbi:MAG: DUF3793 family protein [Ruminococcaceae bacterium]|nr:DUF3793 family protein [Oscillospiraceae bacterium]
MEKLIARHCAPALAGIKSANLVAIDKKKYPEGREEICRLDEKLSKKGIRLEIVAEGKKRLLVLVYRPKVLLRQLGVSGVRELLLGAGYPEGADLGETIDYLKMRLGEEDFPHEIGAFLGYPVEDIYGFIHHKDEGVLLVGEWKVYSDAGAASRLFARFSSCREGLARRLSRGASLAEIFGAQ